MKYSKIIFVFLMAFVASCSNKRQPSDNYPNDYSEYQVTKEHVEPDTIKKDIPTPEPSNLQSSSSSHRKEKELDNMRGFDPASENDMDDNGMQRYFDANDEEAWD